MSLGRLVLKGNVGLYQVLNSTNVETQLIDAATGDWVGPVGPGTVAPGDVGPITGLSIVGRSASTTGNGGNITGTDGQILRVSGTALGFGTILPGSIDSAAGTSIIGKATTGAGANADITGTNGQVLRVSGTTVGFGTLASAAYTAASVNTAALDPNTIQYVTGSLTTAQVKALSTTAVPVIAAPGANKIVVLHSLLLQYIYVTAAYTIGSATNLQAKYTDNSGAAASGTQAVTGMLDQASNQVRLMQANPTSVTPVANAAVVLALAGADVTTGSGTISYFATYSVHTVA